MYFQFVSTFCSGHVVEQQGFDSATFDRGRVARYLDLIRRGEAFVEDVGDIRLDYRPLAPRQARVEVLSPSSFVVVHLLGSTGPDDAMREIGEAFGGLHGIDEAAGGETVGEVARVNDGPLVLALLPEGEEGARDLARYPVALAAAFFEANCG
jgi:hypothetical protein